MADKIQEIEGRLQQLERYVRFQSSQSVIVGKTNPTANTKLTFRHNLGRVPEKFFPVTGDVYVFEMTDKDVDIRSTKTSELFKIIVS